MKDAKGVAGKGIEVVASAAQPVCGSAVWCATMQMCWDNMLATLCEGRPLVPLGGANELAQALNAGAREKGLLTGGYYAYSGERTMRARGEIEAAVRRITGEGSELLDRIDWSEPSPGMISLLFYSLLFRKFSFLVPFGVCEDEPWGDEGDEDDDDVCATYFEAYDPDRRLDQKMRKQVHPLYYVDERHHAVSLQTKEGDEVVLVRSPSGATFAEMWDNAVDLARRADRAKMRPLNDDDTFRCPNLSFAVSKEFLELEGIEFLDATERECKISQALQTVRLRLDNAGGEARSEAAIAVSVGAAMPDFSRMRHFDYDGRFVLFLLDGKVRGHACPYLALLVDDVRLFQ